VSVNRACTPKYVPARKRVRKVKKNKRPRKLLRPFVGTKDLRGLALLEDRFT
jgi:hypothetical protein